MQYEFVCIKKENFFQTIQSFKSENHFINRLGMNEVPYQINPFDECA